MVTWLDLMLRRFLARGRQEGQTEIVIAVVLFILLLMLAGRRVVVQ